MSLLNYLTAKNKRSSNLEMVAMILLSSGKSQVEVCAAVVCCRREGVGGASKNFFFVTKFIFPQFSNILLRIPNTNVYLCEYFDLYTLLQYACLY